MLSVPKSVSNSETRPTDLRVTKATLRHQVELEPTLSN
jgi:hypothetical protein